MSDTINFMNRRLEQIKSRATNSVRPAQTTVRDGSPQSSTALIPVDKLKSYSTDIGKAKRVRDDFAQKVMEALDLEVASKLCRLELSAQIRLILVDMLRDAQINLNSTEMTFVIELILDDMLALGPLEPLLEDDGVTDIMVNGPDRVYVEIGGKLRLTDVRFRDDDHVLQIARRIVSKVGRRIDETSPMVDARLEDGSRVNIIIPPLSLKGPSISIRKFARSVITLDAMVKQENISKPIADLLQIISRCKMNVLISGGTGSGKTTLLNAMSQMIGVDERIVTIEDAAELQLQQPHVVSLETRPANLEGNGEIKIRDLVKNALRMRPDRIIIGECRAEEVVDMLQAMNTGHDGSLGTIHANNSREAFTRLENMFLMAGVDMPTKAIRNQISQAIDIVVQIERMRDGKRRVTEITEVIGMEGEIITTQTLFKYKYMDMDRDGDLVGCWEYSGLRPKFTEEVRYFGLESALNSVLTSA